MYVVQCLSSMCRAIHLDQLFLKKQPDVHMRPPGLAGLAQALLAECCGKCVMLTAVHTAFLSQACTHSHAA